jgi:hypothetical protein
MNHSDEHAKELGKENQEKMAKTANEELAKARHSDLFCSLPALFGLKIGCCDVCTVSTSLAKADDQSEQSTISDEGQEQADVSAKEKQAPAGTWEKLLSDCSDTFCGKTRLPPTIDIVKPLWNGTGPVQSVQQADKEELLASRSILDVESAEDQDLEDDQSVLDLLEQETVVNETIVIYFSGTGSIPKCNNVDAPFAVTQSASVADDFAKNEEISESPTEPRKERNETAVIVVLDPPVETDGKEKHDLPPDSVALQDGYKTPCLSNAEAEGLDGALPSPLRFHILATGSFHEVTMETRDIPKKSEAVLSPTPEEQDNKHEGDEEGYNTMCLSDVGAEGRDADLRSPILVHILVTGSVHDDVKETQAEPEETLSPLFPEEDKEHADVSIDIATTMKTYVAREEADPVTGSVEKGNEVAQTVEAVAEPFTQSDEAEPLPEKQGVDTLIYDLMPDDDTEDVEEADEPGDDDIISDKSGAIIKADKLQALKSHVEPPKEDPVPDTPGVKLISLLAGVF